MIKINLSNLESFIDIKEASKLQKKAEEIAKNLSKTHKEWTGWLNIFSDKDEIERIIKTAAEIRQNSDALIVLGTGGSFLGASFVIDMLKKTDIEIIFLGHSLDAKELTNAIKLIRTKDVTINIISKSGTTLETTVATETLLNEMQKKYGKDEYAKRVICTTNIHGGLIKKLADENGFRMFAVPDDIGGRYSVLTPVGLLPIQTAGIDITKLLAGAKKASNNAMQDCSKYAVARYLLYKSGYTVDLFSLTNCNAGKFGNWLCQLFGESEGKEGKGMFPTFAIYPRDLHSLGQFVQEGKKSLMETFVHFQKTGCDLYTASKSLNELNCIAYEATVKAHRSGKTPIVNIEADMLSEDDLGYLIHFFMLSCAIYCKLIGVDPFTQPGVEEYKKNMKEML